MDLNEVPEIPKPCHIEFFDNLKTKITIILFMIHINASIFFRPENQSLSRRSGPERAYVEGAEECGVREVDLPM